MEKSKSQNIRVAMLMDAWSPICGGGVNHVFEISKNLIQNFDCQIDLYVRSLKDDSGKIFNQNEFLFNGRLRIFRIGKPRLFFNLLGRLNYLNVIFKVLRENKKNKYDLIHCHAYLAIIPGKILKILTSLPLIYTVHGVGLKAWTEMKSGPGAKINYYLEKFLLFKIKCDQVITVSRDYLNYKNVNKNITVIPNGVEIEKFDQVEQKTSDKFKMIFVGRLNKQKGLNYLIEAVNLIKDKLTNCELNIIGDGEEKDNLRLKIKNLKLDNFIKLLGRKTGPELIKEYKSSNLFILPSVYEGQPLTLLEAWASKLPALATNVGDNKNFINHDNGYLVEAKNSRALADGIMQAKNDHGLKNKGLNGYQLVKEKYIWLESAKKIYTIYYNVLS